MFADSLRSPLSKSLLHIQECLKTAPWKSMKEISTELGVFTLTYIDPDGYYEKEEAVQIEMLLPAGWYGFGQGHGNVTPLPCLRMYRSSILDPVR